MSEADRLRELVYELIDVLNDLTKKAKEGRKRKLVYAYGRAKAELSDAVFPLVTHLKGWYEPTTEKVLEDYVQLRIALVTAYDAVFKDEVGKETLDRIATLSDNIKELAKKLTLAYIYDRVSREC